jgi:hypothetical protein
LTLSKPVEEIPVRFHPGICRVEGVDAEIESRAQSKDVKLTAIHEFLRETQSEIRRFAIHRTW